MSIEISTLLTRRNMTDLQPLTNLAAQIGTVRWNLFALVPVAGSREAEMLTSAELERVFAIAMSAPIPIRFVEAPHYRRFLLEQEMGAKLNHIDRMFDEEWSDFASYVSDAGKDRRPAADAIIDGTRSFVFISQAGEVRASEFLPLSAGNLRYRSLVSIYRTSEPFTALRDPATLKGRCGRCEYRHICSGSRARAWAVSGDLFAADPLCGYHPRSEIGLVGPTRFAVHET